jgi:hypothetical protein
MQTPLTKEIHGPRSGGMSNKKSPRQRNRFKNREKKENVGRKKEGTSEENRRAKGGEK